MTVLRFTGKVEQTSGYDVSWTVGGVDVIDVIKAAGFSSKQKLTICLMDERFDVEELYADYGSPGYSEYTPGEAAEITATLRSGEKVGVASKLFDAWLDDKDVDLIIADEPVDLGAL